MVFRNYRVEMPGEPVRGIDLDVFKGEILGVAGLSGQGKLGIVNGLMGLYPSSGTVRFKDEALPLGDVRYAMANGISFVSENRRDIGLILDESIAINICYPQVQILGNFLKAKWLPGGGFINRREMQSFCEQAVADFDIRCHKPTQPTRFLSGGNQQKVCLARALGMRPEVLFVAEPTRGIDIGSKMKILEMLCELSRDGMAIVMISSELKELLMVANRIAVIHGGTIQAVLPQSTSLEKLGLALSGELVQGDMVSHGT